ncbi:hypothetical protein ACFE04_018415 [Oxalis oulophora]
MALVCSCLVDMGLRLSSLLVRNQVFNSACVVHIPLVLLHSRPQARSEKEEENPTADCKLFSFTLVKACNCGYMQLRDMKTFNWSLGSAFANDPPLYSQRQTNPDPNPNTNPNPSQAVSSLASVNKILETVHDDLTSMRKSREAGMKGMFNVHAVLRRREEEINVRLLSREQFFHRATAAKVKAAQMHAQVSDMAARAQPRYAT